VAHTVIGAKLIWLEIRMQWPAFVKLLVSLNTKRSLHSEE
jgi:hypothetical protein